MGERLHVCVCVCVCVCVFFSLFICAFPFPRSLSSIMSVLNLDRKLWSISAMLGNAMKMRKYVFTGFF